MRNGVYKNKKYNKWVANCPARFNNGKKYLGWFDTEQEAVDRRKQWEIDNNYVSNLKNLTLDNIHDYLYLCTDTYDIKYKVNCKRYNIGDVATNTRKDGYKVLSVGKIPLLAHRLVWFFVYGELPTDTIDHKDGNPSNCHIDNLRDVPHKINMKNLKKRTDNTSGITGVYWREDRQCWVAKIHLKSGQCKRKHFKIKQDAIDWRNRMSELHGYHENHGR